VITMQSASPKSSNVHFKCVNHLSPRVAQAVSLSFFSFNVPSLAVAWLTFSANAFGPKPAAVQYPAQMIGVYAAIQPCAELAGSAHKGVFLENLVDVTGIEPATPCLQSRDRKSI